MIWIADRRRVVRLAHQAAADQRALGQVSRGFIHAATTRLATPSAIAWSFAAGALWGAAGDTAGLSRLNRSLGRLLEARLAGQLVTQMKAL